MPWEEFRGSIGVSDGRKMIALLLSAPTVSCSA